MEVRVKLALSDNKDFESSLRSEIDKVGLIEVVDENPELIIELNSEYTKSRGANALQVLTADELDVYQGKVDEGQEERISKQLIEDVLIPFAQANFLRKLEVENSKIQVELSIVPVKIQKKGRTGRASITDTLDLNDFIVNNMIEFPVGQVFMFSIENKSNKDVFINVLDIMPDNKIGLLFPGPGRTVDEYRVPAREKIVFSNDIFKIGPPFGVDNLKIIATKEPIDLTSIVSSRGSSSRGVSADNPFQTLLGESYKSDSSNSRGGSSVSVPPSAGSITTKLYKIVE
jgi:hypothetical protein